MKLHLFSRKTHYWASILVAAPVVVILASGILLQLKKQVAWIQPPERRGESKEPGVSFNRILAACRRLPQARIESWSDVDRIDVRPSRGMLKVLAKSGWEVQLDSRSAEVLQVAYRRSDLIEAIHDGSWFHQQARYWVFLPAGCTLLLMWLTGLYLFWVPIGARRRRRRATAERLTRPPPA